MSLTKTDATHQQWEESAFPITCTRCLGPSPYLRMTRAPYDAACKICERPFTVFRWSPAHGERYRRTEVCQVCARTKNVCQACVLDLSYGVTVEVRDTALALEAEAPMGDVNRQFYAQNVADAVERGETNVGVVRGKVERAAGELMRKAAQAPYAKGKKREICALYVSGECRRGDACPYQHQMPGTKTLDVVAKVSGEREDGRDNASDAALRARLAPPDDMSVATLVAMSLPADVSESDLVDAFTTRTVTVDKVVVARKARCGFITFVSRRDAEAAAERCRDQGVSVRDEALNVTWAKAKSST